MNFQNIPRTDKVIKRAFVPKLDALLFCDYSGIEMRLLAYYLATGIGDESLAREFAEGLDPHTETAKMVLGVEEPTDEERQRGKTLNFSVIYGGGRPTIIRQLGISWEEAGRLLNSFHAARPGLRKLNARLLDVYHERGYIKTLWGRHLHPQDDHKALNALIQGCAADLMKAAMVKVHEGLQGHEAHLVSTIHDELILDVPRIEIPDVVRIVPELMVDGRLTEVLPIDVDVEISYTTWADKRPLMEEECNEETSGLAVQA